MFLKIASTDIYSGYPKLKSKFLGFGVLEKNHVLSHLHGTTIAR